MNRAAHFTPRGDWVLAGRLGGYYDLRHYRHCDHLIGNTRGIVDWIVRPGLARRAGAPPAELLAGHGERRSGITRLAAGAPNRAWRWAGCIATRRFDVLIRALPALPGVHAVIAGEGRNARAPGARWRTRRRRRATASASAGAADTAALLAAADLLVCPSRHEPLGNVVIEAWSARRPVIAAAADGPRELITAGRDGILVPQEDPRALADAIVQPAG